MLPSCRSASRPLIAEIIYCFAENACRAWLARNHYLQCRPGNREPRRNIGESEAVSHGVNSEQSIRTIHEWILQAHDETA